VQGIEILNKELVMIQNDRLVGIAFLLLGIAFIWGCVATKVKNEIFTSISIWIFGLCLFGALCVTIAYIEFKIPSDRYQYETIIQDDVSINEVYEHYKVIKQEGKIWVLEDKESD
jgi:hypothetical protein